MPSPLDPNYVWAPEPIKTVRPGEILARAKVFNVTATMDRYQTMMLADAAIYRKREVLRKLVKDTAEALSEVVPFHTLYNPITDADEFSIRFIMMTVNDYRELRDLLDGVQVPVRESFQWPSLPQ